jgi:hypothetical protein
MGETSMNEPQKKCIDEQEEHHHMHACLRRNYINIHMHPSSGRNIAAAVATFTTWWLFPFPHIYLQEKKTTLSVQHVIYIPQPMSMCRGNVGSANKVSHTGGVTGT